MIYEHTQQGRMYLITMTVMIVVVAIIAVLVPEGDSIVPLVLLLAIGLAVAVAFSRLRVVVLPGEVRVAFGLGWPRRTIWASEIVSVEQVRNRWYHGWGIRKVANGWMFNVWGLDAVELQLANGKVFRIGTDEPDRLVTAISAQARR